MFDTALEVPPQLPVTLRIAGVLDLLPSALDELDPGSLTGREAAELVEGFARIERLACAGRVLCARRVSGTGLWRSNGDRTPAHWLARTSGTSVGEAIGLLAATEQLDALPETEAALRNGDLSGAQVRVIADAAVVARSAESGLVRSAPRLSLAELKENARRAKHAALGSSEADRLERLRQSRHLRTWTDEDGAGCGSWRVTPDAQATIVAAVRALQEKIFRAPRAADDRESAEAYAADALVSLAQGALLAGRSASRTGPGAGSVAKIIVRADATALARGHAETGEVCEIVGIGPVPVSIVRSWWVDAFKALVVTDGPGGSDVRSVVHLGRTLTARQRTALEWMSPSCSVEGCAATDRLEIDHRIDWARTRHTTLGELDLLCHHHHALKTRENWSLGPGSGKRAFIPPRRSRAPDRGP